MTCAKCGQDHRTVGIAVERVEYDVYLRAAGDKLAKSQRVQAGHETARCLVCSAPLEAEVAELIRRD